MVKAQKGEKGKKKMTKKEERIRIKSPTKSQAAVVIRQQQNTKLMAKKFNMTGKAANFFISATDPMHDSSVTLAGWPDRNIELSVIRKIPQVVTIAFPQDNSHFSPEEIVSWEAHLHLQPWLNTMVFSKHGRVNNTIIASENLETAKIGGLQVFAVPPGLPFAYGTNDPLTGICPQIAEIQLQPEYTQGVGRIVGFGVEAINTTASLYKQGHVYCWRAPEPNLQPATFSEERQPDSPDPAVPVASYPFSGQFYRHPPRLAAEALLYTGTQDWPAGEGAYMVGTFHDFENPATAVNYIQPMMTEVVDGEDKTYNEPGDYPANISPVWHPREVTNPSSPTFHGAPGTKLYPINQMGMIFTGLSRQSTIDVKLNIYYESFPSIAQKDILSLAYPSTAYNERVLKLLSAVMRTMPVATMSKNNATGDWWDKVLEALEFVAPGVLSVFGGELLAPGAVGALSAIRTYRNR